MERQADGPASPKAYLTLMLMNRSDLSPTKGRTDELVAKKSIFRKGSGIQVIFL